jgi:Protein of unknown function (DUF2752)
VTRSVETQVPWRDRLLLAAPLLAAALLLTVPPGAGPTICPFALATGMACPGCGMTRAASLLLRGDLDGALTFHPLILLVAVQLAAGWVWFLLRRTGKVRPMSPRLLASLLIGTGVIFLAVWGLRWANGSLPPV